MRARKPARIGDTSPFVDWVGHRKPGFAVNYFREDYCICPYYSVCLRGGLSGLGGVVIGFAGGSPRGGSRDCTFTKLAPILQPADCPSH